MGLIIQYASHNFRFIMFNPTQRTSKSAPKFLSESQDENMCQPLCIDSQVTESASWRHNIYQVNHLNTPMSLRVSTCKTYIKCSQIHKSIQSNNNKISKGKLNSSQQDREGKTPYDPTILTKPTIHQDRAISRTWERDIKHIATGTNPHPQGGLLTHYHGEKESCWWRGAAPKRWRRWRPRRRRRAAAPCPPFFLGLGDAMEEPLPFLAAAKGEANSWLLVALPKLGFFSPYMCLCGALWTSDGWTLDPMALGHL